jgi:hypothetical protein
MCRMVGIPAFVILSAMRKALPHSTGSAPSSLSRWLTGWRARSAELPSKKWTVRMKTTRKQKEVVFHEKANTWKQEDGDLSNRQAGYDSVSRCQSLSRCTLSKPGIGLSSKSSINRPKKRCWTSRTVWRRGYAEKEKMARYATRSGSRGT